MLSVTGLLDQRGVDVDPALELAAAGPAAGPLVLARDNRSGAGNAADRRVAAIVQRVVRDLVDVDVGLHAFGVPIDDRLHLPDAVAFGPFDLLRAGAAQRLLPADPGHPGVVGRERALERLDLSDLAAAVRVRLPQAIGRVVRPNGPQLQAVALDQAVTRLVGLRKEDERVELDDRNVELQLADHVDQHGRLALPGTGEAHAVAELLVGPAEHLLGAHGLDVRKSERRRGRQAAPPSACPHADRAGASRAG